VGHVGLDVKDGGAVQDVHIAQVDGVARNPGQLQHGQADGIGARGRAGGENAVVGIVEERPHHQGKALHPMEMVEQENMGKTFQVAQAPGEIRVDLDMAGHAQGSHGLHGHAFDVGKGRTQDADGPIGDGMVAAAVHRRIPGADPAAAVSRQAWAPHAKVPDAGRVPDTKMPYFVNTGSAAVGQRVCMSRKNGIA